jgi:putative hydrolase of HD superfamily
MILDFFKVAANLKNISRQGWLDKLSMSNPESVADHSYSMAVIGMVISDLENYDSEKILKMILLHDLAESKVGDFTPGQLNKEEKTDLENNAFNQITEKLPGIIKYKYLKIWNEYQENISPESKIVHQIDKLEMALQAKLYQSDEYPYEKFESFFESAEKEITNPTLKEIFTKILEDS